MAVAWRVRHVAVHVGAAQLDRHHPMKKARRIPEGFGTDLVVFEELFLHRCGRHANRDAAAAKICFDLNGLRHLAWPWSSEHDWY